MSNVTHTEVAAIVARAFRLEQRELGCHGTATKLVYGTVAVRWARSAGAWAMRRHTTANWTDIVRACGMTNRSEGARKTVEDLVGRAEWALQNDRVFIDRLDEIEDAIDVTHERRVDDPDAPLVMPDTTPDLSGCARDGERVVALVFGMYGVPVAAAGTVDTYGSAAHRWARRTAIVMLDRYTLERWEGIASLCGMPRGGRTTQIVQDACRRWDTDVANDAVLARMTDRVARAICERPYICPSLAAAGDHAHA